MSKVIKMRRGKVEEVTTLTELASEEMDHLYDGTFHPFEEGTILKAVVVRVESDGVAVDVGYKSEAVIPREEFSPEEYSGLKMGDLLSVFLEEMEDADGNLLLSKEKADKIKTWQEVEEIYKTDGVIEGKVISQIKGGVVVDIGVKAFLPGSQIDFRPLRDFGSIMGKTFSLKIVNMSPKRGNIVVSRRAFLEKNREQKRNTVLSSLQEGQVIEGLVKNITDYGAFIDLGGIDGLLHITDIAWSRVAHPSDHFRVGEKLSVIILKYDKETSRVSLGLKQLSVDPWKTIDTRYAIGARVTGRVVSFADYGVFLEVEHGIEGLIHISDLSWTRDVKHPSKVVAMGDSVEAAILNIDRKARKLSLGLKQVESNPWDQMEGRYPPGTTISGKIKSITDFGVFVGLDDRIDGLLHVSDVSWTRHIKHPSELFKKGQDIEAVILKVDREKGRISLGYKQLTPDPWKEILAKYKVGSVVSGRVSRQADFGFFIEMSEGIEGLVHVSETGVETTDNLAELFPVSSEVSARVIRLDPDERKIALSLRNIPDKE